MNTLDYIKQRFTFIGTITDEGASDFALDVNENGFSVSWSADAAKAFVKMALRKYGIEPNGDTSALVGLSVIKDASNLW